MRKTIHFGNAVDVEIELKDGVFSVCGAVWNGNHTDHLVGGQCLDELVTLVPTEKMKRIHKLWKRWHLNDMHAGCEHQRKLGWEKDGYDKHPSESCPTCNYKFGTEWKMEVIPSEVIKEMEELFL